LGCRLPSAIDQAKEQSDCLAIRKHAAICLKIGGSTDKQKKKSD
jgi:hypothetical protein